MGNSQNISKVKKQSSAKLKRISHEDVQETRCHVLLLGIGGSGKTTCFNHLALINNLDGVTNNYEGPILDHSFSNILKCLSLLSKGKDKPVPEFELFSSLYQKFQEDACARDPRKLALILTKKYNLIDVYQKNLKEFNFNDEVGYFLSFDNIQRFVEIGYVATKQDILSVRTKTTGINSFNVVLDNIVLHIFDVGGQRSERRKWKHCFENTDVLVYVVSLSDYDDPLYEDPKVMGITECMETFDKTVNGENFRDHPVVVYFNKQDVLHRKISLADDLIKIFPEYKGGMDPKEAEAFLIRKFMDLIKTNLNRVSYYVGSAIDPKSIVELQNGVIFQTDFLNSNKKLRRMSIKTSSMPSTKSFPKSPGTPSGTPGTPVGSPTKRSSGRLLELRRHDL